MSRDPARSDLEIRDGLCRYIRSKGMYTGPHAPDPNALPYDATVWWCGMTEKTLGPDDRPCHRLDCTAARPCYEGA